jgi:Arc/MetJ family transcription regulator
MPRPLGFESERTVGIDHDTSHGDRYERRTASYGSAATRLSRWDGGGDDFIARTVRCLGYARLKRTDKGVVLRFLRHVSGYSRQQEKAIRDIVES